MTTTDEYRTLGATPKEIWGFMRETARQMEINRIEAAQRSKETDKKLNKLEQLFTSQWGKLIESLVEGDLINILNSYGINIEETTTRLKSGRRAAADYEFDIIAHNGDEVVVVEVKTTLRPDDVKHFTHKMSHFKQWVKLYREKKVFGAMAFLTSDSEAALMAEKRGMHVIRATGNSAAIVNKSGFKPKTW